MGIHALFQGVLIFFSIQCNDYSIMEGEQSLRKYSPELLVQDQNNRTAVSLLPPVILFHGTADYSIPPDARLESAFK